MLRPFDRQTLGDIHPMAAAIIAQTGKAFGIFIGQHRALGLKHRARDNVLRGDELDLEILAREFTRHRGREFRIGLRQRTHEISFMLPGPVLNDCVCRHVKFLIPRP